MEFLRIDTSDKERWEKIWNLYESSFPLAERRTKEDHIRASKDEAFHPISIWERGRLLGILFYWEYETFRYLEYLAVVEDERGRSIGTQILKHLLDSPLPVILEIDPLINELSVRRLQFYERADFKLTPFRFVHLPYRIGVEPQELLILSYPNMISKEQYNQFLKFMEEKVICYCEGYKPENSVNE